MAARQSTKRLSDAISHQSTRKSSIADALGMQQRSSSNSTICSSSGTLSSCILPKTTYLYRPGTLPCLLAFAEEHRDAHFLAPYDYPDYYQMPLHRGCLQMRYAAGYHWRSAGTTCLTFLTRRSILRRSQTLWRTYAKGNFDASMWMALTKHGVFHPLRNVRSSTEAAIMAKAWLWGWRRILFGKRWTLWVPIPSMATHLERTTLAPGVDWEAVRQQVEEAYS